MAEAERVDHEARPGQLREAVIKGEDARGRGEIEREAFGAGDRAVAQGQPCAPARQDVRHGAG